MILDTESFAQTDDAQFVYRIDNMHYIVVEGLLFPDNNLTFRLFDIDFKDKKLSDYEDLVDQYYPRSSDRTAVENMIGSYKYATYQYYYLLVAEMIAEQAYDLDPNCDDVTVENINLDVDTDLIRYIGKGMISDYLEKIYH